VAAIAPKTRALYNSHRACPGSSELKAELASARLKQFALSFT
jgi:hypothetical protein